MRSSSHHWLIVAGILFIVTVTAVLYIPFLGNELVFDDKGVFGLRLYDHAQRIRLKPRSFPNFTLGLVHVLTGGSIAANRIVSLVIHLLCTGMLFALVKSLLYQTLITNAPNLKELKDLTFKVTIVGIVAATWFAINPVAVYGAGYLAQRTILFATLFSLLSLWFFLRSFRENRTADIVTAALFYSAAVFSKEHAIMLPLAAAPFAALYVRDLRLEVKRIGLYLALCAPAGLTALVVAKSVIATSYEPDASTLLLQLSEGALLSKGELLDYPAGKWAMSVLTQTSLFFSYPSYWLAPNINTMSADMRIDFAQIWSTWKIIKASLFIIVPVFAVYFIRARGTKALVGCGLFYCWSLFFTELVSIRIQEPFVFYRSYLWAPGYVFILAVVFNMLSTRWIYVFAIPAFTLLLFLSYDRLTSFKDEGTLWKDAATKLESEMILGSERIFYNRGLQYMREKNFDQAISDFSRAANKSPTIYHIFYQRGIAYYSTSEFEKALADFNHALSLTNTNGALHYAQGLALEKLGSRKEALSAFQISAKLGFYPAQLRINGL